MGSQRTTWSVRAGIALLSLLLVACNKPASQDVAAEDDPLAMLRTQAEENNAQAQYRLAMA
ncbi:MAG: hypothetical protein HC808_04905 [Candidatus Competibacteraceae bacterium]|nr:hypothetical protein [Candidatus Competibacteraceae bacterium]